MAASASTVIQARSRYAGQAGTSWGSWKPKRGRKLKVAEIPGALAAHDRAQQASNELRADAGLPPVPENQTVLAWRERLNGSAPRSTDSDPLEELRKAVAARKRAESRILKAVRSAKDAAGASTVAGELGMSRQGVYAMLARSGA